MDIKALTDQIAAVCPIDGVSIGKENDKTTWRIDYAANATPAQKAAAQSVVDGFDASIAPDPLDRWDVVTLKIAFNHENRIRALESKAPVTVAQFKTAVRALL